MSEETEYANREIDEKFKNLDTLIREKHDDVMVKISGLDMKVSFTNGKVRKIIMVLLVLGGILVGQAFTNTHDIIALFANAL